MASVAKGVREDLASALRSAAGLGQFSANPMKVLSLRVTGSNEIENLTQGVLHLLVAPGSRRVEVADRADVLRSIAVQVIVAMHPHSQQRDKSLDDCEEVVERVEDWLADRSHEGPYGGAFFRRFVELPITREPFSIDSLVEPKPIFIAAIMPEYEVVQ